jgi:hypothetical protein
MGIREKHFETVPNWRVVIHVRSLHQEVRRFSATPKLPIDGPSIFRDCQYSFTIVIEEIKREAARPPKTIRAYLSAA